MFLGRFRVICLFVGGGFSFGGMIIVGVWVMVGDVVILVNRDGIIGGEEIRLVEGDWVVVVLVFGIV